MSANANNISTVQYYDGSGIDNSIQQGSGEYLVPDVFLNTVSPVKGLPFPGTGSTTIKLEPRTVNFTANTLGNTKQVYSTKLQTDIANLDAFFADWGMSYQITEGPALKISVDVPWDSITGQDFTITEYSEEQWEIVPIQGSKSLIYNGLLSDPFSPINQEGNYSVLPLTLQSAVQRAVKTGGNALNPTSSLFLTPAQQSQFAAFVPEMNRILTYSYLGIDGVPAYTQQLKRTAVIDVNNKQGAFQQAVDQARNQINAQGSVNYILSTDGMQQSYAIRESVAAFMLPSYSKKLGVQALDPITYNVYAGWLVTPPTVQFIGLNKIQITQLFLWDEWAEGMFYIQSPINDFPNVINTTLS
jgi:hypothetical protein